MPDQRNELTLGDGEIEVLDDFSRPLRRGEGFSEPPDLEILLHAPTAATSGVRTAGGRAGRSVRRRLALSSNQSTTSVRIARKRGSRTSSRRSRGRSRSTVTLG